MKHTGLLSHRRLTPVAGRNGFALAVCLAALAITPVSARAAEYYVAPNGSDSAAGSSSAPFASLSKANSSAAAGDTIWVHGGSYYLTTQLVLSKSGTSDTSRTKIWAVQGETPVLDASRYVTSDAAVDVPVVLVTGNYMHLRGLEIANAKVGASGDHSYSLLRTKNASNNTFEMLNIHHGFGPGLFIDTGTGGNLILNCDSHDTSDKAGSQGDGQTGDGFGVHYQKTGPSTTIRGCRAWMDSDDGYDLISQEVPVTVEGSFAFQNGYGSDGNGNGFKMGSSQTGIRHIVQNNVAWKNKAAGFYANHSTGGNTWYNNTSYNNGVQYNMLASSFDSSGNVTGTIVLTGSKVHIMRNNIGFHDKNSNMDGVDTASNTWDLAISESSSDFASTDPTGCDGPRQTDGSMPAACTFMRLKSGSPLIDKGKDVGLPFVGQAPDLGAFEFGATTSAGGAGGAATSAGGSSGSAGSTGAGGSSGLGGSQQSGGSTGAGGNTGTGGASRADAGTNDAATSAGGAVGSGGSSSTGGGAAVAGGATSASSGGSVASGGRSSAASGGATASSGGSVGSAGGISSTGATGGTSNPGSGGAVSTAGTGGNTASGQGGSGATMPAGSSGCSCAVGGAHPRPSLTWLLMAALGLAFSRARRQI